MVSGPDQHQLAPELRLAGTFNTRDLGGHRSGDGRQVRWRRAIRSDALGNLSEDDLGLLSRLKIHTVIDLRSASELEAHGPAPVERFGARHLHLPVLAETWDPSAATAGLPDAHFLAARYCEMTDEGFAAIAAAIETVALANGPVLFHCAVGKDRTGVVAALLLALLGVDDRAIARDYARSEPAVARLVAAHCERAADVAAAEAPVKEPPVPPVFLAAPPSAIRLWLDVFRSGEHIERVVLARGMDPRVIERLRRNLLA
jgi:protein-tyrosine phosphatase